jgi:alkylation response protein AidB-like acyl-CoA dehydrogenase
MKAEGTWTVPAADKAKAYNAIGASPGRPKPICFNCGEEQSKQVADRAIQVMGGYGYVGEYKVERFWRDAKLLEIGGGTNESHHKNMCRDLRKMGSTRLD